MRFKTMLYAQRGGAMESEGQIMIKKSMVLSVILIIFTSCATTKQHEIRNSYSIKLDDKYLVENNEYSIDEKFNFIIEAEKPINGVFIILSPERININSYIGKDKDATEFSVGNMIITDKNKEQLLYYNSRLVNNYISQDGNNTVFSKKIDGIVSTTEIKTDNKLFCYSYCDLNNNSIVEKNEIKTIVINMVKQDHLNDKKIYISTVGYRIKQYNKVENKYTIYKIGSYKGYLKYKENVATYVSNYDLIFEDESKFETGVNYYIVISPVSNKIELSQPYKYNNSDLLIFDVDENTKISEQEYISARNYRVKKSDDKLKICININGKIIFPEIINY